MREVCGFSKLSKLEKLNFVVDEYLESKSTLKENLKNFSYQNKTLQDIHDQFSENTISNFHLPYGVAMNMLINDEVYCVPMVTEESSVVAACNKSAKFWSKRGGFHAEVISTFKSGQVHFYFEGKKEKLKKVFKENISHLIKSLEPINKKMIERGGGIKQVELLDKTDLDNNYYQLNVKFDTCDAMGANYINTNLEYLAANLKKLFNTGDINIVFSIVSNYAPESIVKTSICCKVSDLTDYEINLGPYEFAKQFEKAVKIANIDISRAVTHNKGIMNGIDAVALATGNDFRAIESCAHAYASESGTYKGLTDIRLTDDLFYYELTLPISVGTVGGLTNLHPLAKISLDMLGRPSARELMRVMASVGLAQNFAAIKSLITSGIQKGHMKMHLINILNYFEACESEREEAYKYFKGKKISFNEVRNFLGTVRDIH